MNLILMGILAAMSTDVSQLAARLRDADPAVRGGAAEQLCQLGDGAAPAAAQLAIATGDEDEAVREWATAALEELGPPPSAQVAALVDVLSAGDSDAGYWAATLLGRLGSEGAPAAAALAVALNGESATNVRERCAWALGKIGAKTDGVTAALREAAACDQPRLARLATQALEQLA